MFKTIKCLLVYFSFFFVSITSCAEEEKLLPPKTECEQIKDIMTDCLNLHRGALGYVDSCGDISLTKVKSFDSCDEILEYINIKD